MSGARLSCVDRRHGRRWSFASCVLDEDLWSLSVKGRRVALEGKPLELLHELLLAGGKVVSKEELLDLMLDAIEAEIEVPEPTGDWRADLGAFAHRTRAALRQHQWAVEFIGTRPPSGPNDVRNLERLLSLLDGIGVDDYGVVMGIFMTVATFVIGAVIREAQEVRFQAEQERVEASMTAEEVQAEHERFRDWFESSGQYPHIARLMKAGIDPDDPATRDERFQFSLDCVLDGVAARIALAAREPKARDSHLSG